MSSRDFIPPTLQILIKTRNFFIEQQLEHVMEDMIYQDLLCNR